MYIINFTLLRKMLLIVASEMYVLVLYLNTFKCTWPRVGQYYDIIVKP